jgi:Domain of unknown function (DUF4476)
MKTISMFLITCLMALSLYAQNGANTVTISLNTNRYQQVLVDGKVYPVNTSTTTTTGFNSIVTITDLQPGQHELQLVRVNQNTNTRRNNTSTFNVRSRYDLAITVNNDGTIELKETRNRNLGNAGRYRTPMSDADFSVLLQNVQTQRRANAKTTAVTNAIENVNYYFTTEQAVELLELVSSENKRFSLAKAVYPKITDTRNVSLMYDLFDIQSNKDAFVTYVDTYNTNHSGSSNYGNSKNQYRTPMTEANFNSLLQSVKKQWIPGAKMSALTDAFASENNYFTSYQAKQLIQLVSDEDNRLQLAKSAYARITDPANFSQLYDLFSTQARKNELANYINSYSYNRY